MSVYFIGALQEMPGGKKKKKKKSCCRPCDGGVRFPQPVVRRGALAAVMYCRNATRCLRFLYEVAARLRAHTA